MYHFYYTDSLQQRHKVPYELHSYNSVMQLLWDQGFEDWGDCKGRGWCGTCQVQTNALPMEEDLDIEERKCLRQLPNKNSYSRLSCQVLLDKNTHQAEFSFLGDE